MSGHRRDERDEPVDEPESREVVPPALHGDRLDRVVALVTGHSRAQAAALVEGGRVTVGGRAVTRRSHRLHEGDVVEVGSGPAVPGGDIPADPDVPVAVVHEDPDLLVVDKPAGLVVHPGAGQTTATLVNGLLARYPELRDVGAPDRPGIVHRLDKGTSGLLLVARSPRAYQALVAMLSARQVSRRYRVLVWGEPAAPTGMVDAPIGRSLRDRTRMAVVAAGKPARTRFEVIRTFHEPVTVTELRCGLETGRTHQIRVHLASVGHPVVGDTRYGGRRPSLPLGRPWLHAANLELAHPVSGRELRFESPLPPDLAAVLDQLR